MTNRQKRALDQNSARLTLGSSRVNLEGAFGRQAATVLEIGFGMGESLLAQAASAPELNFLGIEVYPPGVGTCLAGVDERGLDNLKVIQEDAVIVLADYLPAASVDQVQIFFPDPWPKKRHHKRRLIQTPLLKPLAKTLKPGGVLWIATDWAPYAEDIDALLASTNQFQPVSSKYALIQRCQTKYERRGLQLEHPIADLLYLNSQ